MINYAPATSLHLIKSCREQIVISVCLPVMESHEKYRITAYEIYINFVEGITYPETHTLPKLT